MPFVLQPFLGLVAFPQSKQDSNINKIHQHPIPFHVFSSQSLFIQIHVFDGNNSKSKNVLVFNIQ